ncbi:hypothetical protein EUGRSUZ_H01730 [Eucalyptus grandis]|uniref:Uncharacterized protein n=2 Tax=Eucalyptus grandis TaxID=71139 RepID=A0ACC3JPW7_EUCGR|nr:hypothetical protein EUGRSUZ_H01730 [Eucalyptus grandis]
MQADALGMLNGINANNGDRDSNNYLEDAHGSTPVLLGSSIPAKNAVRTIKLPEVKRLLPFTTWIFLDRNQRMTEDQSVVGRRRIYYDQNGGEALICSDSEEEAIEEEEDKREFVDSEDFILRMTIKELGLSDSVLESLANCLSRSPSEVKARYEVLIKEEKDVGRSKNGDNEETSQTVFDCRLHGCSQDLVLPVDKQPIWSHTDEENVPCGPRCYRSALKLVKGATVSSPGSGDPEDKPNPSSNGSKSHVLTRKKSASSSDRSRLKQCQSESASSNAKSASESSDSETGPRQDGSARVLSPRKTRSAGKSGLRKRNSKRVAERVPVCLRKRQKMMASDSDSIASGSLPSGEMKLRSKLQEENEDATSSQKKLKCPVIGRPSRM